MPNRIIKESITYSEDIDRLKPFEETVFYRLLVRCDDYGRLDARSSFLKSMLFVTKAGITEKNVEDAVAQLACIGLIDLYEVEGKPYLCFPKWHLHQRLRNSKEKYPAPPEISNSRQLAATRCEYPPNPIQSESNPKPNCARSGGSILSDKEALPLADGIHDALDAAKRAGFPDTQADWDKCNAIVADYGADAVIKAIDVCTDRPVNMRNWGYLRGILKSDPSGGKQPTQRPKFV